MFASFYRSGVSRRTFIGSAAAAGAGVLGGFLPRPLRAQYKTVKIGFLDPLTGPVAAWGKPGLDGFQIWA